MGTPRLADPVMHIFGSSGYGTKLDGPHGTSTVYVHGFGTDDGYDRHTTPHRGGYGGASQAYGYGHIDPYLSAKHGYGYSSGYGYNQVTKVMQTLRMILNVCMGRLHKELPVYSHKWYTGT